MIERESWNLQEDKRFCRKQTSLPNPGQITRLYRLFSLSHSHTPCVCFLVVLQPTPVEKGVGKGWLCNSFGI